MSETETKPPAAPTPPGPPETEAETRQRVREYHDILLTSSSILAGFSLTGLLGLPEVGQQGIEEVAVSLGLTYSYLAFPVAYVSMLMATIAFLGVLIAIVSFRFQSTPLTLQRLKLSFKISVLVFGIGIANLFSATIAFAVPSGGGLVVGILGGAAMVVVLLYRAFWMQKS